MGPAPTRFDVDGPRLSGPRARVLEFLQQATTAVSVDDLAGALGLHPNTARKHLEGLVAVGAATSRTAPSTSRGRPARTYVAAGHAEPDTRVRDYAALATALAGHLSRTSADPRTQALAAGDAWGRSLTERCLPGSPARARTAVVELLAELGFDPQGDATARTVRLRRCPLLDAARAFPDVVCAVHLGIVRGALAELGADPDAAALLPFSEPGACRLHLTAPTRAQR
jgi:predicted ArsR family transcriptional regulator